MNRKFEAEAGLERSLKNQVSAPRLDRNFDAAVWARIEAQEAPFVATTSNEEIAPAPRPARWLSVINTVGVLIAVALVVLFGLQSLAGIEFDVAMPEISATTTASIMTLLGKIIAAAALVFGLNFTAIGRRMRAELS